MHKTPPSQPARLFFDRMTVFVRIEKHLSIKPLFDLKNGDS